MGRAKEVPITPAVLGWAIDESGYSLDEVAKAAKVPPQTARAWIAGHGRPTVTHFRALGAKLKRPLATFLLPEPPLRSIPSVDFRHPPGVQGRSLNPTERLHLREASRIQRTAAWILQELGRDTLVLPRLRISSSPERAAAETRRKLDVSVQEQCEWSSASVALQTWRTSLEKSGVLVLLLSMGQESCRGFSLWDDRAPAIAVNTWWNQESRIFTLFHEYGHLLTRTNSACIDGARRRRAAQDPAERWCEQFAAALLLPWDAVTEYLMETHHWNPSDKIRDLHLVGRLARRFKTSLRATALRLIEREVATWELYGSIRPISDQKSGGGGGGGRIRREKRQDELGVRTTKVFLDAIKEDVLGRADVLDYLDVSDSDLEHLTQTVE